MNDLPPPGSGIEVDSQEDYHHHSEDPDYSDYEPGHVGVINSHSQSHSGMGGSVEYNNNANVNNNFSNNWNLSSIIPTVSSDLNGSKTGKPLLEDYSDTRSPFHDDMSPDALACHLGISLDMMPPYPAIDTEIGDIGSGSNVNGTLSSISSSPFGNYTGSDIISGGTGVSVEIATTTPLSNDWNPFGLSPSAMGNFSSSLCPRHWDGILCWPETQAGQTATLSCFAELNGIPYDSSHNATRFCGDKGWNNTIYDYCQPLHPSGGTQDVDASSLLSLTTGVYFAGYMVSLGALIFAMIIFLSFKELRCLRNTIHTHLIITYILADTLWIITSSTTFTSSTLPDTQIQPGVGQSQGQGNHVSCVTFILLHYFHLTNFFWMFVEGLYLYVLVVQTFVAERIKLRVYVGIGWGIPLTIVIGWALAKWLTQPHGADNQSLDPEFDASCVWLAVNNYDWIFKAPAILVLAANILFLLQIMWVLITKLRSATNPETQQSVKAAKALVVLMPLFGITYLLVLSGSREPIYEFIRALLISTQGFLVALLYCFINGEVRKAVRHRLNQIRTMGFGGTSCCEFNNRRRQMSHMRDWSPRSRTESIRLYTPATHSFRKRESSASEATTMTTFPACGSLNSNGMGGMGPRHSTAYLSHKILNNGNSNVESNNTFI